MLKANFINRQNKLRKSLDYNQLREAGIARLQKLAGTVWTDYNTHDPGVTLLELLCYAITDLSYRCDFSIEDILASHPENKIGDTPDFFEAHRILPGHPLTILDYRKILIDLPFIRNAWIEPAANTEQEVFFDQHNHELTFHPADDNGRPNEQIKLKGLYNVWLELAEDEKLGNLNAATAGFDIEISDGPLKHPAHVSVFFPHHAQLAAHWKQEMTITNITTLITVNPDPWFDFNVKATVAFDNENEAILPLSVVVDSGKFDWTTKMTQVRKKIGDALKDITPSGILPVFNQKHISIKHHLDYVTGFLDRRRNLCEDFLSVQLVIPQEIALEAEIGLSLDTDTEELLAQAFCDIHHFFSPPVRFYSLQEMLAENISTEDIFDGPLLKHGFIKDTNLTAFRQSKHIYASDILNVFISSNPEKIKYVTGLKISNYIENIQISHANSNILQLHQSDIYKPVAGVRKSNIYCKKGDVYQVVNWHKVEQLFKAKIIQAEPDKSFEPDHRLELPAGSDRSTQKYVSVQEDLPPTYGTSWRGLPSDVPPERKALAKQLKGYLLFFDQLLANFLAQLSNVKNLFSTDHAVAKTYFEQAVYQVPDAMFLLRDFIGSHEEGTRQSLLDEAWKIFKDDGNNDYINVLQAINEDKQTFLDRRNRFLDHLMARFNEHFTDYSLLMFAQNNQQIPDSLLENKESFLQNYPELSSRRSKGFSIKDHDELWNTENVSGFEKRVAHLLGFVDYSRRFLVKGPFGHIQFYQEIDNDNIDEYRFRVLSENNKILLSSHKHYHVLDEGYDVVFRMLDYGKYPANYKTFPSQNEMFYFNLYDDEENILARRIQLFETEAEAQTAIDEVVAFINENFTGVEDESEEGFLVIDHLLLRPKLNSIIEGTTIRDTMLPVVRDDYGNLTQPGKDPYSFRTTVVFPAGLNKFKDENFKELAEQTVRLETPAHIMPSVHFLNNLQLSRLEHAYKTWLELSALAVPEAPGEKLSHLKALNQALFELEGAIQFVPEEPDL